MVRFRLDPDNPPQMTAEQMQALRDEEIDFSDIPEQTGGGWRRVSELVPAKTSSRSRCASMPI